MDGQGHSSFEEVILNDNGAAYYQFSLALNSSGGDPSKGAVNVSGIPILPAYAGDWTSPDKITWRARGTQIGYGFMTIAGQYEDAFDDFLNSPLIPFQVKLAPNVMLVPVQMIRVLPAGYANPNCDPSTWTGGYEYLACTRPAAYKAYWDDVQMFVVQHESAPYYPNNKTFYTYDTTSSQNVRFNRVDGIWRQCNIQFRMIDCGGRDQGQGCPHLIVDSTDRVAPTVCEAGFQNYPQMRDNFYDAVHLPGVTTQLPVVISVARPSGDCTGATPVDVAQTGQAVFSMQYQSQFPLVAAHEMGHVLGLNDYTCDQNDPTTWHLMCSDARLQNTRILPSDCASARAQAAGYVRTKWGVEIQP